MDYLRNWWRFLVAVQLLPALESGEETLVGGQAVLEGVMMRSPHAWAIAVRKPSGEVATHSEPLERPSDKHKWMGWPVIRGIMTLGYAMSLGFRALRFSADVALEHIAPAEEKGKKLEISGWVAAVNIILSLGFFIVMYKFLPLLAARELGHVSPFFAPSLMRDIRRVYEYHGAEHKTVFAFENGDPLSTATVQKYSTYHPRCGTSFLMTVMIFSIFVYMMANAILPVTTFAAQFATRIVLLPLIAGLSYEIIRFAARHRGSLFALMTTPGLWLQRITTQPPADDQVHCAIVALDQAMELEKQNGGEFVIA